MRRYTENGWLESPERASASRICARLGCSGMSPRCPGNPHCPILEKAVRSGVVDDIVDEFMTTVEPAQEDPT